MVRTRARILYFVSLTLANRESRYNVESRSLLWLSSDALVAAPLSSSPANRRHRHTGRPRLGSAIQWHLRPSRSSQHSRSILHGRAIPTCCPVRWSTLYFSCLLYPAAIRCTWQLVSISAGVDARAKFRPLESVGRKEVSESCSLASLRALLYVYLSSKDMRLWKSSFTLLCKRVMRRRCQERSRIMQ